ncbi:MAG: HAMP domain-containing sensor histidine kinase [Candidatus Izemoplasma sp.]
MISFTHVFRKRIVITLSLIVTVLFVLINFMFYYLNSTYLDKYIENENTSFVELTNHLLLENDLFVATEYVEHYSHIHEVELEFYENDVLVFSTPKSLVKFSSYTIKLGADIYTLNIDNTSSTSVIINYDFIIYANVGLITIYILLIGLLLHYTSIQFNKVASDLERIIKNLEYKVSQPETEFSFIEFNEINTEIVSALKLLDLIKEKSNSKIKALIHDVKTPLTVLYSSLENQATEEQCSSESVSRNIKLLKEINSTLSLAFIEQDELNTPFNISKSLENIIETNSSVFNTKNITINQSIQQDIMLPWNNRDFVHVVTNLLSNAFYYSKNDTIVDVSLKRNQDIVLVIKDQGVGISQEDTLNLFDKSFRSSNTKAMNQHGKGIGLYFVKLLLDDVMADISIDSTINKGTTVTIKFKNN